MRGTVTQKKGRWYICYYVGKDQNGKWKQKWEGSWKTKSEAEKVLRARVHDIENSYDRKADESTMEVFLRQWMKAYCEPRLARNTINAYRINVEKHMVPYIGQIKLNRLSPRDIQGLYETLLASGLSGNSVRHVHNNLHRALLWAVKQQLIARNPADLVDAPLIEQKERLTLTPEQIPALLVACEGHFIYLPVAMAVTLGLRRGEALGLQWIDVDLQRFTITIRHSVTCDKTGFTLGKTKTRNSRRTLMLPEFLVKTLRQEQDKQRMLRQLMGEKYNPMGLVCCRADGSPITTNALQHCFKDKLREAELPDIRFHDLRHTNATLMLRNQIPAKIVSSMLGHSTIGITMDLYSHVTTDMQGNAVQVINDLLKSGGTSQC